MPRLPSLDNGYEPIAGYRLIDFLGRGQFGEVWKAVDASGKRVAIKIIDLEQNTAALKELRAFKLLRNMDHPHLVAIYTARLKDKQGREVDFEKAEQAKDRGQLKELVIAMGLGDKSLSARLKELNPDGTLPENRTGIPIRELIPYMEGAAKGIDFLNSPDHRLGADDGPIIHCDIKPDNMLIQNGEVQIADCGVAIMVNNDLRRKTQAAGTMAYNPPELMGNKPGPGTDQYSLAISYYELRTGHFPFPEDVTQWELMTIHAQGRLDFNHPIVTEAELKALRRATAIQTRDRFDSCQKFVRALKRAVIDQLDDMEMVAPPTTGSLGGSGGSMNTGSGKSLMLDLTPQQIELPPAPPPVRATTPPPGLTATIRPGAGGMMAPSLLQTNLPTAAPPPSDDIMSTRQVSDSAAHLKIQEDLRRGTRDTTVPPVTATPRGAEPKYGRSSIEFEIDDGGSEQMLRPPDDTPDYPPSSSSVPELPDLGMIVPIPRPPLLRKEVTPPPAIQADAPVPTGTVKYPLGVEPDAAPTQQADAEPMVEAAPEPRLLVDDDGVVTGTKRKSKAPLIVAVVGVGLVACIGVVVMVIKGGQGDRAQESSSTKPDGGSLPTSSGTKPETTKPIPPPSDWALGERRTKLQTQVARRIEDGKFDQIPDLLRDELSGEKYANDETAKELLADLETSAKLGNPRTDTPENRISAAKGLKVLEGKTGFETAARKRIGELSKTWQVAIVSSLNKDGEQISVAKGEFDEFKKTIGVPAPALTAIEDAWKLRVARKVKTASEKDLAGLNEELSVFGKEFTGATEYVATEMGKRKREIEKDQLALQNKRYTTDLAKALGGSSESAQLNGLVELLKQPGELDVARIARLVAEREPFNSSAEFRRKLVKALPAVRMANRKIAPAAFDPFRPAVVKDIAGWFDTGVATRLADRGKFKSATEAKFDATVVQQAYRQVQDDSKAAADAFDAEWKPDDVASPVQRLAVEAWVAATTSPRKTDALFELLTTGSNPPPFAAGLALEYVDAVKDGDPTTTLRKVWKQAGTWLGQPTAGTYSDWLRDEYVARLGEYVQAAVRKGTIEEKLAGRVGPDADLSPWVGLALAERALTNNAVVPSLPNVPATADSKLRAFASYLQSAVTLADRSASTEKRANANDVLAGLYPAVGGEAVVAVKERKDRAAAYLLNGSESLLGPLMPEKPAGLPPLYPAPVAYRSKPEALQARGWLDAADRLSASRDGKTARLLLLARAQLDEPVTAPVETLTAALGQIRPAQPAQYADVDLALLHAVFGSTVEGRQAALKAHFASYLRAMNDRIDQLHAETAVGQKSQVRGDYVTQFNADINKLFTLCDADGVPAETRAALRICRSRLHLFNSIEIGKKTEGGAVAVVKAAKEALETAVSYSSNDPELKSEAEAWLSYARLVAHMYAGTGKNLDTGEWDSIRNLANAAKDGGWRIAWVTLAYMKHAELDHGGYPLRNALLPPDKYRLKELTRAALSDWKTADEYYRKAASTKRIGNPDFHYNRAAYSFKYANTRAFIEGVSDDVTREFQFAAAECDRAIQDAHSYPWVVRRLMGLAQEDEAWMNSKPTAAAFDVAAKTLTVAINEADAEFPPEMNDRDIKIGVKKLSLRADLGRTYFRAALFAPDVDQTKMFELAATEYEAVLSADAKFVLNPGVLAEATYNMARLHFARSNAESARVAFRKVVDLKHPQYSPYSRVYLVRMLVDTKTRGGTTDWKADASALRGEIATAVSKSGDTDEEKLVAHQLAYVPDYLDGLIAEADGDPGAAVKSYITAAEKFRLAAEDGKQVAGVDFYFHSLRRLLSVGKADGTNPLPEADRAKFSAAMNDHLKRFPFYIDVSVR